MDLQERRPASAPARVRAVHSLRALKRTLRQTIWLPVSAAVAIVLFVPALVKAQVPAPLSAPYLPLLMNGFVGAIAQQPDGGVVFGGDFTSVGGISRNHIARLKPDGSLDLDWNPFGEVLAGVSAIAVDGQGAIYVGGGFNEAGGSTTNRIAKLGSDGTIDVGWSASSDQPVWALTVDAVGDVYAGGGFYEIGGQPRTALAKLSGATGQVIANWSADAGPYIPHVFALMVGADDNVYVGGDFQTIGGQPRNYLARVSAETGAVDSDWNPSSGYVLLTLAADTNGAIYAGGSFRDMNGQPRDLVAKLSAETGAVDPNWSASLNGAFVFALAVGADHALYAGGDFSYGPGNTRRNIVKLSPSTGGVDPDWNSTANGEVRMLTVGSDGTIYSGGLFNRIGGEDRLAFAALSPDGNATSTVADAEHSGFVDALAVQPDNSVIVGGYFQKVGPTKRHNLLRVRPDGSLDGTWDPSADDLVRSVAIDGSGAVYAAGDFTSIGAQHRTGIAKLTGDTGLAFKSWSADASNIDGTKISVAALTLATDGSVFAGGNFAQIGGQLRNGLAKLSTATGAAVPEWNVPAELSPSVSTLLADGSDGLYVGGSLLYSNEPTSLVKVSVVAGDIIWNATPAGDVHTLALGPDRSVYAAADYSPFIWKLSKDTGAPVSGWNPAPTDFYPNSLLVGSDGFVYAGGSATAGLSSSRLAKLSGNAGSRESSWHPQPDGAVAALALAADGAIYVGGAFDLIGGNVRNGLAALPDVAPDAIFANDFDAPP